MTSSGSDSHWLAVKAFIQQHLKPEDQILAPSRFKRELPNTAAYNASYGAPPDRFQWVVVHKGRLEAIEPTFLQQVATGLTPVLANEVFVLLSSRADVSPQPIDRQHLHAFLQTVAPDRLFPEPVATPSVLKTVWRRVKQGVPLSGNATPLQHLSQQLQTVLTRLTALETAMQQWRQESKRSTAIRKINVLASLSLDEFRTACRSACQTAYLGNDTILGRILTNYLLYGDTRDVGIVPHLCMNGFWEPWVTLAVLRTLKPGWSCLDVGANHGYYAVVMASAIGSTGQVTAIEPNPRLADLVQKTLEVNGFGDRARVVPKAVSDQDDQIVKLVIPAGHTGHASMHIAATANDEVVEVPTVAIDSLTQGTVIDFIKIDVEGAEEAVWRGMLQTIRRSPKIVIVLEFGAARHTDPGAFLASIQAEGFQLRYIDYDTTAKPITVERLLSDRLDSYWDLYLSRES